MLKKNEQKLSGQQSPSKLLNLEVEVDLDKNEFKVGSSLFMGNELLSTSNQTPRRLEKSWYPMLLKFNKSRVMEVHMDTKMDKSKVYEVSYAQHFPDNGQFFVSLGNSCFDIMKSSSDQLGYDYNDRVHGAAIRHPGLHKSHFRGRVSLPFFFRGCSQFHTMISNTDQQELSKCFKE